MSSRSMASKDIYGETLIKLGKRDERVVAVEADLMKASGSTAFMKEFPDRHINVGIAEQDLVGVASGLASMGKIPFASSFANFISQRSCDQIVNSVAFNRFNVKLCGIYAGLTSEKNGGTHISVEDIAIFRSMPNMTVIDPADCAELASAMEWAVEYDGPVYIRIARTFAGAIFDNRYRFEAGKAVVLQEGSDIGLITTGITTLEGIEASKILKSKGIAVRHVHMPAIKPLDREEVLKTARMTGTIITAENHSVIGGLASAVAETVSGEYPVFVHGLGINDQFGETASIDWLMDKFGISCPHIIEKAEKIIRSKRK